MLKYQIMMWWSEDDQSYLAMMPQIPGCIADGPTPEEALVQVREVAEICLDFARERGYPIPHPSGDFVPVSHMFDWQDWPKVFASAETAPAKPKNNVKKTTSRSKRTSKSHVHA